MKPSDLWRFVGRSDVFAEQQPSGAYFPVKRQLTDEDLAEHLAGFWSIGTYVVHPDDNTVSFVVFDLDTHDEGQLRTLKGAVESLVMKAQGLGDEWEYYFPCVLEKSGGKGYHIWLFLDEPVEAARIRRWLDTDFWPVYVDSGGLPNLEVFPKQDQVREGGYGNLVKLPFGTHAVSGKKSELVPTQQWVSRLDTIRGLNTDSIPEYAPPAVTAGLTASDAPTGVLQSDGRVAQLIRGEVGKGERNHAFHAFFTWTAWNVHLPSDLAWEWWVRLNEALEEPEANDSEVLSTMESAYAQPPSDAASPRRGGGRSYRDRPNPRVPLDERAAARGGK